LDPEKAGIVTEPLAEVFKEPRETNLPLIIRAACTVADFGSDFTVGAIAFPEATIN
jgi:hypothetical protein